MKIIDYKKHLNKYSFPDKFKKATYRQEIADFLQEKYLDIMSDADKITTINLSQIVQEFVNIKSIDNIKERNLVLFWGERFIDVFLITNYNKNFATKNTKLMPRTDIESYNKENVDRCESQRERNIPIEVHTKNFFEEIKTTLNEVGKESGYNNYNDAIVNEVDNFFMNENLKYKNSCFWTSAGKSFATNQFVANRFDEIDKLVITTPNKSNLPKIDKLIQYIRRNGTIPAIVSDEYLKDKIIMLNSKTDNFIDNIDGLKKLSDSLNEYYTTQNQDKEIIEIIKSIDSLIKKIETHNNIAIKKSGKTDYVDENEKLYKEFWRDQCDKQGDIFKSLLKQYLLKLNIDGLTQKEKIENLLKVKHLQPLKYVFPQLLAYNAKVIILSASKMLYPIDMLLFSHVNIIESDIINTKTKSVFDEVDDIYMVFLNKILEDSTKNSSKCDVLAFLSAMYTFTKEHSQLHLEDVDDEVLKKWNNEIYSELKLLFKDFKIGNFNFITQANLDDEYQGYKMPNALIYTSDDDCCISSMGENTFEFLSYEINDVNNTIVIKPTNDKPDDSHNLEILVTEINNIYKKTKELIFLLTKKYFEYHKNNKEINIKWKSGIALKSLLVKFTGNVNYVESIIDIFSNEFVNKEMFAGNKNIIETIGEIGLANDFSVYHFENSESHKENTILYSYINNTSPETLLFKWLAKTEKTLFLSASGYLKSTKCNFDFDKIEKSLKLYFASNTTVLETIKNEKSFAISDSVVKYKQILDKFAYPKELRENIFVVQKKKADSKMFEEELLNVLQTIDKLFDVYPTIFNISQRETLVSDIKNIVENTHDNDKYNLVRTLRQFDFILNSILRQHRTALIIRNKGYEKNKYEKLSILIQSLKDFISQNGYTIKDISLKELSQSPTNDSEFDYKIDEVLERLYIKEKNKNTILYILISSIATAGTGINMYQWIPIDEIDFSKNRNNKDKRFTWKIPDYNRIIDTTKKNETKTTYIKADIDAIYSENKSYIKTVFNKDMSSEEKFKAQYYALYHQNKQSKMFDNLDEISKSEYVSAINDILLYSSASNFSKFNRISNLVAEMKFFSQIQGRKERTCIATKYQSVWFENSDIQIDGKTGFEFIFDNINEPVISYCNQIEHITLTGTMAKIKDVLNQKNRHQMIETSVYKPKTQILKSLWRPDKTKKDKKNIALYNWIKSGILLSNITLTDEGFKALSEQYDKNDFDFSLSDFYVPNIGGIYAYQFNESSETDAILASFDRDANFKHIFSKNELMIDVMNDKFFNDDKIIQGIHFNNDDAWIISPEFADIIKGDCGEHCYRILGQKYDFSTEHLEGQEKEFFDYSTENECRFIDIKYQNVENLKDYLNIEHIISKLEHIKPHGTNASVLIINMYPHNSTGCLEENIEVLGVGDQIQVINQVIDEQGKINNEAIKLILEFVKQKENRK